MPNTLICNRSIFMVVLVPLQTNHLGIDAVKLIHIVPLLIPLPQKDYKKNSESPLVIKRKSYVILCGRDGSVPMWYFVPLTVLFVAAGWSNSAVTLVPQGANKTETSLDLDGGCRGWRPCENRHKSW